MSAALSCGTIHGVGLGPGAPDLLSVRTDRLVRGARHVAYFRKAGRPGQARRIAQGSEDLRLRLWDVRSKAEAEIVSLPFADMLHPHRQVAHIAASLPRDRDILVHCKAGVRSAAACHTLAGLGFTRLYSMDGGIVQWAKKVDPSMPVY